MGGRKRLAGGCGAGGIVDRDAEGENAEEATIPMKQSNRWENREKKEDEESTWW